LSTFTLQNHEQRPTERLQLTGGIFITQGDANNAIYFIMKGADVDAIFTFETLCTKLTNTFMSVGDSRPASSGRIAPIDSDDGLQANTLLVNFLNSDGLTEETLHGGRDSPKLAEVGIDLKMSLLTLVFVKEFEAESLDLTRLQIHCTSDGSGFQHNFLWAAPVSSALISWDTELTRWATALTVRFATFDADILRKTPNCATGTENTFFSASAGLVTSSSLIQSKSIPSLTPIRAAFLITDSGSVNRPAFAIEVSTQVLSGGIKAAVSVCTTLLLFGTLVLVFSGYGSEKDTFFVTHWESDGHKITMSNMYRTGHSGFEWDINDLT
jgi:hypothetical protein